MFNGFKCWYFFFSILSTNFFTFYSEAHQSEARNPINAHQHHDVSGDNMLGYQVRFKSINNIIFCENCGNNQITKAVRGGDNVSQYVVMIDTPFYAFLYRPTSPEAGISPWVYIAKSSKQPNVQSLCLDDAINIINIKPAFDADSIQLQADYTDGSKRIFVLDNHSSSAADRPCGNYRPLTQTGSILVPAPQTSHDAIRQSESVH